VKGKTLSPLSWRRLIRVCPLSSGTGSRTKSPRKVLFKTPKYNDYFKKIFRDIEKLAVIHEPVLITGESGSGKELPARAIHLASGFKGKYLKINIAGLDDTMFSDTLFGHHLNSIFLH
jgi:DNA-binding NtrC family response regulator